MVNPDGITTTETNVELSDNTVLGIPQEVYDSIIENPDGSLEIVEPEKKEPESKEEDKSTETKKEEPKTEESSGKTTEPEKATGKETKKTEEDVKPEKEDSEEQPQEGEEVTDEDKEFQEQLTDKIKEFYKNYKTPEERDQIMKDLENHSKFTASNTRRAQELAKEREVFDALVKRLAAPEVIEIINEFEKSEDKETVLKSLDQWYDEEGKDPSKNVIRKVFDALLKSAPEADLLSHERSKLEIEKNQIDLEKERVALEKLKDPNHDYGKEEEFEAIWKYADEYAKNTGNFIDLITAHKLRSLDDMASKVGSLNKKIDSLTKELKERNEEVDNLKSKGKVEPVETSTSGKVPKRESYKEKPKDDRERLDRMSKDFDVLMNE
jgi:hypothetical protein